MGASTMSPRQFIQDIRQKVDDSLNVHCAICKKPTRIWKAKKAEIRVNDIFGNPIAYVHEKICPTCAFTYTEEE